MKLFVYLMCMSTPPPTYFTVSCQSAANSRLMQSSIFYLMMIEVMIMIIEMVMMMIIEMVMMLMSVVRVVVPFLVSLLPRIQLNRQHILILHSSVEPGNGVISERIIVFPVHPYPIDDVFDATKVKGTVICAILCIHTRPG